MVTSNTNTQAAVRTYEPQDSIVVFQGQKAKDANSKVWSLMLTYADASKKPAFLNDVVAFKTKTGGFRIVKSRQSNGVSFNNALASL